MQRGAAWLPCVALLFTQYSLVANDAVIKPKHPLVSTILYESKFRCLFFFQRFLRIKNSKSALAAFFPPIKSCSALSQQRSNKIQLPRVQVRGLATEPFPQRKESGVCSHSGKELRETYTAIFGSFWKKHCPVHRTTADCSQ